MARSTKPTTTLSLFHAPYVDEDGLDRMRLSGVLTGADLGSDAGVALVKTVRDALVQCAEESTVLVVDESIDVRWL